MLKKPSIKERLAAIDAQIKQELPDVKLQVAASKGVKPRSKGLLDEGVKKAKSYVEGGVNAAKFVAADVGKNVVNLADVGQKLRKKTLPEWQQKAEEPYLDAPLSKVKDYLESIKQGAAEKDPSLEKPWAGLGGIPDKIKESIGEGAASTITQHPALNKGIKGFTKNALEQVEGLTSPGMIGTLAASAPSKLLTSTFLPGLVEGTIEGGKQTLDALKKGAPEDVGAGLAQTLGSGAFALGLGKSLLKGKKAAPRIEKPLENVVEPKAIEPIQDLPKKGRKIYVRPKPEAPTGRVSSRVFIPEESVSIKRPEGKPGKVFVETPQYKAAKQKFGPVVDKYIPKEKQGTWQKPEQKVSPAFKEAVDLYGEKAAKKLFPKDAKTLKPQPEIIESFSAKAEPVETLPIKQLNKGKKITAEIPQIKTEQPLKKGKTFTTSDVKKLELPSEERGSIDLTKSDMSPAKSIAYEIAAKENKARANIKKDPLKSLKNEIITKINDELYVPQDMLKQAEKKVNLGKVAKPSERFYEQTGRVYNAKSMANQIMQDTGLINAIQAAPDPIILDQVMKAKHAFDLTKEGFKTGRNPIADSTILETYGKEYEPFSKAIVNHSQKMLDYAVDAGVISPDFAKGLKEKYPNYVPFNRIIETIEGAEPPKLDLKKAKASLGKQTFIKKMKGSDLPVENSIQNILKKTYEIVQQAEVNRAGLELANAQKVLPDLKQIYWEVDPKSTPKLSFDVLDGGVKRRFETNSPELVNAVKGLNYKQMSNLMKIINIPNRLFKSGTTGFRSSFMVVNPFRDVQSAFVNLPFGEKVAAGFFKGLYDVAGKTEKFNDLVRNGVLSSSFDVFKDVPEKTVESIRSKRSKMARIRYNMNPKNFFDALDDIEQKLSIPEYGTRVSVNKAAFEYYKKKGFSEADAKIKANIDARKGTTDFQRRGEWSQAIGTLFPYLRAGIAGTRSKIHYFKENPVSMSTRLTLGVLLPVAITTLWNLSDEKRAKAYFDAKLYEKENNFFMMPSDVKKDDRNRYQAFKLPMSPEFKNEARIMQQLLETVYAKNPADIKEFGQNLLGILSPITSPRDVVSSLSPTLKSPLEQQANFDVYRDKPIEPYSMQSKPLHKRTYDWTPKSINRLAKFVGTSPLRMQKFLYDFGGGLWGQDLPYLVDEAFFEKEKGKVGTKSILQSIKDRFYGVAGGQKKEDKRTRKIERLGQ